MRTLIDPPLETWRLGPFDGAERHVLPPLVYCDRAQASRPPLDVSRPILATGHQPWLWHPGILAKDFAAVSAARRLNATPLHLVVDHDALDAVRLELPIQQGDQLAVETLRLGPANAAVPTAAQPTIDGDEAIRVLCEARDRLGPSLMADLNSLIEAIDATHTVTHTSLAEQISAWLARLMQPYCGSVPMIPSSALLQTPPGEALLAAMLADTRNCVRCYNEAVAQHPEAGVEPLLVEPDRVELPIWALHWNSPRQRVFADLADATPLLTFEDGTPLPSASHDGHNPRWLAPRALLLTGLMRSHLCELFVHGRGGGLYDRATEHWWQTWRRETLAPATVVSADLHLAFDVPLIDRAELARARWYRHYAPFNIDRLRKLDGPLVAQKWRLIGDMDADRNPRRRWLAFREIQRLNSALQMAHPDVLDEADRRLATARRAVANRRVADKRDWCFALHPPASLTALRVAIDRPAPVRT